jgi:tRNA-dihydrouridine synthase B
LKRYPGRTPVIYQLMLGDGSEPIEEIIAHLARLEPAGFDVNLACHAPFIRRTGAGSRLFDNPAIFGAALKRIRGCWPGLLTVKIRLGHEEPGWEAVFTERLRVLEGCGIDAVTLHPRFVEWRFKRRARHELYPWMASLTALPVIASGDIVGPQSVVRIGASFEALRGLMIGRMALVKPWVFAAWAAPVSVDYAEVWQRMAQYVREDYPDEADVVERLKAFTGYYSRNFKFGHSLFTAIQKAHTLEALRGAVLKFLETSAEEDAEPSLSVI